MVQPTRKVPVPLWQRGEDPSVSAWKAGTTLGPYRLERLLGSGSFGEVWEAADHTVPAAPRRVAVKILSVVGVPGGLRALQREAEICRDLNHPNIIEILGVQATDDAAWVVMEFVPGPTLEQAARLLAARGLRLPRAPLLDVGIGVARALQHAWSAPGRDGAPLQIAHRNLRPAEVLLSEEGEVKVGGFSLARVADDDRNTATGVLRGSPTYIPPERWRGSREHTPASDLYSLGVLLWELAVGGRFFPKINVGEMFALIERRTPQEEAAVAGVLFPELAPLLERLLDRDPDRRPQSARDVRKELQALRESIAGEGSLDQFVWMLGTLELDEDEPQPLDGDSLEVAWDRLVERAEGSMREPPAAATTSPEFWDDRDWKREDWKGWEPATWSRSQPALPAIAVPDPVPAEVAAPSIPAPRPSKPRASAVGPAASRALVVGLSALVLVLAVVFVLVLLRRGS